MLQPDVEAGPGYLIKRVQQQLRRRCDAALRPTGLSMAQYAALRALADHPDASAAELARLCFVTRQSLQDVLGALRSTGLVALSDAQTPGRARALQLTALGSERLLVSHAVAEGVEALMVQGISPSAQSKLVELLSQCGDNLEREV
jgi:DNA-binding MarR family transcriptional regulator